MKTLFFTTLTLILAPMTAKADENLFVELKCQKCHTVASKSIETTSKKDPSEIADLSKTGANHDLAWLTAYLKKEKELNGKKHKMKFKGDADQLKAMAAWLASLKE